MHLVPPDGRTYGCPPFRSRGTRAQVLRRRALSFSMFGLGWVLLWAGLPLWIALALAADLAISAIGRRPLRLAVLRTLVFWALYLSCEVIAVLVGGLLWIARCLGRPWAISLRANYAVQWTWTWAMFGGALRIWGMRTEIEGGEVLDRPGPIYVFSRHRSTGDTLLPLYLVSVGHGYALRYVIKEELLSDPALDVIGSRMPIAFVRRGKGDPAAEVEEVCRLAQDLHPWEGVAIYPEGTRFSPEKREKQLARLQEQGDALRLARARALHHTLLPRTGGPVQLLAVNPGADVVFLAHCGFEGVTSLWQFVTGALVGRTLKAKLWRVPAAEIPRDPDAAETWLYEQWRQVDAWVAANAPGV